MCVYKAVLVYHIVCDTEQTVLYYKRLYRDYQAVWMSGTGFALNPCCSRNICPLSVTNKSEETKAITNQAARWAFLLKSWGGAGTNAVTTPSSLLFPPSPLPSCFDILDPHMGKSRPSPSTLIIPQIMTERWWSYHSKLHAAYVKDCLFYLSMALLSKTQANLCNTICER